MATRIDHSNCNHPRTPAGRAACRKGNTPATSPNPDTKRAAWMADCTDRNGTCMSNLCLCNEPNGGPGTRAAKRAAEAMKKADAKVRVITRVEDLPMPKLTPAQLDSPIIQSMLRKRG